MIHRRRQRRRPHLLLHRPSSGPRLLAGALALVVAAAGLAGTADVAGAADPLPPLADPRAPDAFCDGAPGTNPFTDLGAESAATREVILCLVATGLTTGATRTTYEPGATVTRRQMALFVKRLADLLDDLETGTPELAALPAYDGTPEYPDVAADDPGAEAIGQLTQAGIVGGFPDGRFRPTAEVSRRQMAAFVNRLRDHLVGAPFPVTGDYFDDDDGDAGEDDLDALAGAGIFQGDGAGNVHPGADISRRQMANILLRAAQVHLVEESIEPRFDPDAEAPADEAPSGTQAFGLVVQVERATFASLDSGVAVYFRTGDAYRTLDTDSGLFAAVTSTSFHQNLSVDDTLFTCTGPNGEPAPYSSTTPNEICLVDSAPSGPRGVRSASAPTATSIALTWDPSPTAADTYVVNVNDEPCASTTVAELSPATTVPGTQTNATVTGLASGTTHCVVVTTRQADDTSPLAVGTAPQDADNTVELTTT